METPSVNSLLHAAVLESNERAVRFLLKQGADPNARMRASGEQTQLEPTYRSRSSSLSLGGARPCGPLPPGTSVTLESFVPRGCPASVEVAGGAASPAPLHVAATLGCRPVLELLLAHGAEIDAPMESQLTGLMLSVAHSRLEAAELLVARGARLDARDRRGRTALYMAVRARQPRMVELLLAGGADPNAPTEHGLSPLHVAVERRLFDVVGMLLARGSDVNATTRTGVTPLHCAAVRGQTDLAELLLKHGADVRAILKLGRLDVMPLLFVSEYEKRKVAALLGRYAPKPSATSFYGKLVKKIWKHFPGRKLLG